MIEPETLAEIVEVIGPHWDAVRKASARSLKKSAKGFLPADPEEDVLGCGVWGCVWKTSDPRFVVKVSLDATEGPHVALAMKHFQRDPGIAYYHRLWRLQDRIWHPGQGNTFVWIMLREEVDVRAQYGRGDKPARGFKKVYDVLEELPDCCSCLVYRRSDEIRGLCSHEDYEADRKEFLRLAGRLAKTPGSYVGKLIQKAYRTWEILLGDVHFDNVGKRIHDLRQFKVPRHSKLVITDLANLNQPPITTDQYPKVAVLKNPTYRSLARGVRVLPRR